MSDDLIKRAREAAEPWDYGEPDTLITELADRIEAQAAEIERLKGALEDEAQRYVDNTESLYDEIERLRNVVDSLIDRISGMEALTPPATIILDPAALTGKAEQ